MALMTIVTVKSMKWEQKSVGEIVDRVLLPVRMVNGVVARVRPPRRKSVMGWMMIVMVRLMSV